MENNLHMRFPGGRKKAFTMSFDDGVEQDARLIEIMNRNGLKGTFNINSGCFSPEGTVHKPGQVHRRMTLAQAKALYLGSGHEVAVHTSTHPYMEQLPLALAAMETLEDRRTLEREFGGIVRGMAYPFGTRAATDPIVEMLKAAGIAYARTTVSTGRFGLPTSQEDWLRLPATCHSEDPRLMELGQQFLDAQWDWEASLFYLWGHSYEFEQNDSWQRIEEFAALIGGHPEIWYATNIQIYDYVAAYGQLRFNLDMTLVENPTAVDLFFGWREQEYVVEAGKTLSLG